jgi:5-enolpyruvylshikimate-3-phosphate synthase
MALAIAGTAASGETVLSGAEVIQESYPGFAAGLRGLGVNLG